MADEIKTIDTSQVYLPIIIKLDRDKFTNLDVLDINEILVDLTKQPVNVLQTIWTFIKVVPKGIQILLFIINIVRILTMTNDQKKTILGIVTALLGLLTGVLHVTIPSFITADVVTGIIAFLFSAYAGIHGMLAKSVQTTPVILPSPPVVPSYSVGQKNG